MQKKNVLFITSECAPFAKVGGLADVAGALPQALNQEGLEVRVIMPLYKKIKEKYHDKLKFLRWSVIQMGWRNVYTGVFEMEHDKVHYYFIDNEFYFGHDSVYIQYEFDIERYIFFQRAVLEAMGDPIQFVPDILHCNDWQTGLIPALLEAHYKRQGQWLDLKTVFTIHNLKYQGLCGYDKVAELAHLNHEFLHDYGITKDGVPNFLKAGLVYSNYITTVSETYAEEILNAYFGEGLEEVLQSYAYKLKGIVNGIDTQEYNPSLDKFIAFNYNQDNVREGKAKNKKALQIRLGLEEKEDALLVGMVSRLVDQKGLDLILNVLKECLSLPIQMVILGTGDVAYEESLRYFEQQYKGQMVSYIAYNNEIAHQIYAASDIFLMPSLFEPCGLSQLISMAYGTLPLVRETGGLKDTVKPYNQFENTGTGFSFANINAHDMLFTLERAVKVFNEDPQAWDGLVHRAMQVDSSWNKSALVYKSIYENL